MECPKLHVGVNIASSVVKGTAYLLERVTDAKAFCLRLLLMCHELSSDEWEMLRLPGAVAVDNEMMGSNEFPINSNGSSPRAHPYIGPSTRSRKNGGGNESERVVFRGTLGCEEDDAHEQREAEIEQMLRWEARCFGYEYLGEHELQQHNSIVS